MAFPFKPNPQSDLALWVQLAQRIAYLIETGYYRPGDQLPTVRGLAADISINYNTVNKAYTSLASQGYIKSTRGKGCFVLNRMPDATRNNFAEVEKLITDCIKSCRELGLSIDETTRAFGDIAKRMKRSENTSSKDWNIININDIGQEKKIN